MGGKKDFKIVKLIATKKSASLFVGNVTYVTMFPN